MIEAFGAKTNIKSNTWICLFCYVHGDKYPSVVHHKKVEGDKQRDQYPALI